MLRIRIVPLLIATMLFLVGCSSSSDSSSKSDKNEKDDEKPRITADASDIELAENPYRDDLIKLVQVTSAKCTENNGSYVLNATVNILPYGQMIDKYLEEIESSSDSVTMFGEKLYQQILAVAGTEKTVAKEISVNVAAEIASLNEAELYAFAAETAFDMEIDAYCMNAVMDVAPLLSFEEGNS